MKKIATIVLTILLAAALMAMPALAAENPSASMSNTTGIAGETVTMTVSLTGFDRVNSLIVEVDAGELEYQPSGSKWLLEGNMTEVEKSIAWVAKNGNAVGVNKDVLQLAFKLPAEEVFDPSYEVAITIYTNLDPVGAEGVKATATVDCGHKYEEVVTGVSCTVNGERYNVCKYCGADDGKIEHAPALGHKWSDWEITKVATCAEEGTKTHECLRDGCGAVETVPIEKVPHDWADATCTAPKTCPDCSATTGMALGHDMGGWEITTTPTTSIDGVETRECLRDGCDYSEDRSIGKKPSTPVAKIANVSATGKIKISWGAIDIADNYQVYRAEAKDGTYTRLATITGTSYTDGTAAAGTTYYYKIRAISETSVKSSFSGVVAKTCKLEQPVVTIANVSASGKPKLTWGKVSGAVKYTIYRAESKTGTYTTLKSTTGTSYTDTSAEAGTTYYYQVVAVYSSSKSAANSVKSDAVGKTCRLEQVEATIANVAASGKPKLTWGKVSGAAKYTVYRSTSKTSGFEALKSTTGTSYTDTTAKAGTTYYYQVVAVHSSKSAANSVKSDVVGKTCKLEQVEATIANVAASGKPKLTWGKVSGAAKYTVYRSTSKTSGFETLKSTTSTSYTDTSAKAGTTYYYQVVAVYSSSKPAANSVKSDAVGKTCKLEQTEVTIANVAASGKPELTWDKVSGAAKYTVYRATSKTGTYKAIKTTTGTSYTDTTAKAGTTYYYQVVAVHSSKSAANSAKSAAVGKTCKLERPDVAIKLSSGKPRLSWDEVSGAAKYTVYRATSETGTYKAIKTTTGLKYADTSAKAGTTYYYKVVAVHSSKTAANSAYSIIDYIKSK